MSQIEFENNNIIMDVLKEIGNIGAGNAATALANMINKKVDMQVPKVKLLSFPEVSQLLGGEEILVSAVLFKIEGDLDGTIMFALDMDSVYNLIHLLMGQEINEVNEYTSSMLKEIGNILSGAYISSLSTLTNLNIKISIPSLAVDMAGAILSVPAIEFGKMGDKILIIENEFIESFNSEKVVGYFFLIPDADSYDILLKSLGVIDG